MGGWELRLKPAWRERPATREPMTTAVAVRREPVSVAEEHHLGDGDRLSVSDGDQAAAHLHAVGAPGGAAVQPQLRRTGDPNHLDVLPQHAAGVAGAWRMLERQEL